MIKAVVFDLDHTLYDRYGTIELAAHTVRKRFSVAEGVTDEQIASEWKEHDKRLAHHGLDKLYTELARCGIFNEPPTREDMIKLHYDTYTTFFAPYDFAIPTVMELKRRGFAVALITNGRPHVQRKKIEMLGMSELFDEIIVGGEFGLQKPHTEIFYAMAERLGIKTGEMLYVGDNPINDVKGSADAGCVPVWVRTTPWNFPDMPIPKLTVENVTGLLELDELK